ncbi:uncharacterized protein LOC110719172 [Chenopodium quinoa]|uniref:uncharacterized protein LOC110719172 n=1 Tax=Chenopodium quinoa TaxID=63459 RepID=UPI000B79277D|nr:uncharacterized protein LOC110719172 [Chenopodium quinoa]
MSVLLVAEQNSDLLLKNHNLRPTGSLALIMRQMQQVLIHSRQMLHEEVDVEITMVVEKVVEIIADEAEDVKGQSSGSHKQTLSKGKDTCYRCGMTGHWGRTCRTAKHLVDLYQASVKGKEKNAEANYVNEENAPCPTLDVSDFFMDNAETGNDFIFGENNNA